MTVNYYKELFNFETRTAVDQIKENGLKRQLRANRLGAFTFNERKIKKESNL